MIDVQELKTKLDSGISLREISNYFSTSLSTIKRVMVKNGLSSKFYEIKRENLTCLNCGTEFQSLKSDNRKFCSNSCSSKFNNKLRTRERKCVGGNMKLPKKRKRKYKEINHGNCLFCEKSIIRKDGRSSRAKYCSVSCQQNYQMNLRVGDGRASTDTLKIYLIKKFGNKCMVCNWDKINPISGKVPIELDHIDGNSENNELSNLRLLCPNCHSLTPTYKSLNRGKGRKYRRERYNIGKSY